MYLKKSLGVLLASACMALSKDCMHTFTDPVEAKFDLSELKKEASDFYKAMDTFSATERPYTYYFNVCSDTEFADSELSGICKSGYPVYQIINDTKRDPICFELGDTETVKWSLIDGEDDAELGVTLNYTYGQDCLDVPGKDRSFVIHFKCRRHESSLPSVSSVTEFKKCEYEVTMHSFWACPVECRENGEKENLCGGHGVCGLDSANKTARCYCNENKTGSDCLEEMELSTTDYTSSLLAVIVILLVLIAVVVFLLYKKIKLLNEDSNPYQAYDEDGVTQSESALPVEEDEETL